MNQEQAVNEIFEVFRAIWSPLGYEAQWPNSIQQEPIDDRIFARVTLRHVTNDTSISRVLGRKLTEHSGVLTIQIFTRLGGGLGPGLSLSSQVARGYRGHRTPGGCWFRNVVAAEVGPTKRWYQHNVNAEFTYEEVV